VIYLFYGPDEFSISESVQKQLRAALPPDTADMNTTRLSAEQVTPDALRFACEAAPFLADRRAVVVDRFFSRAGARRARGGRAAAGAPAEGTEERAEPALPASVGGVAAYLPHVPPNTLLIFVEGETLPKTAAITKALEAAKVKQQFFPSLAGQPLVRWIRDRAKGLGGQIADNASAVLADYVGGDLRTLSNELAKLITYAGPGRKVEVEDVRLLVNQTNEVNVFALVDAVSQGQLKQTLAALHSLTEMGERPERILGMVARQVRLLVQARDLADRRAPADQATKTLGLVGFPLRKVQEQAARFQMPRLREMHRRTLEADLAVKTGQQESGLALELLVTDLARRG
jgi:DNA polymerase III subunit delta